MFIHDLIKIKLSRLGYLPDYPPHLISDEEMCDAFLPYKYDADDPEGGYEDCMASTLNYFRDTYYIDSECGINTDTSLDDIYRKLVVDIAYYIHQLKSDLTGDYVLPNWVYSYMLGEVLGPKSDKLDLHDLFIMLGTDNTDDVFTIDCAKACYRESKAWLAKIPESLKVHRPNSIFGEMHVLKSLRLQAADITNDEIRDRIQDDISSGRQVI